VGAVRGYSHIYDADGRLLGRYEAAACRWFSEHDMGWVAASRDYLALLTPDGSVRWRRASCPVGQAVVDVRGRVFVARDDELVCFDADSVLLFTAALPGGTPLGTTGTSWLERLSNCSRNAIVKTTPERCNDME
jgi:hypothetical protein